MSRKRLLSLITLVLALCPCAHAQLWSGIISSSRAIDWSQAGVKGGIPDRTITYQTFMPSATAAQINTALANCPANQVVYLSAGTYTLSSSLLMTGVSNCTLRGAGADQTYLSFTGASGCNGAAASICLQGSDVNWKGGPSNSANWTAGYAAGSATITLSSVTNLKVGNPIILDQLDNTNDTGALVWTDSTSAGTFTSPGIGGPYSLQGNGGGASRSGRQQEQIVTVTQCDGNSTAGHACSSGSNIGISPAIYMGNWSSAYSPQAWWATAPALYDGVENLTVDSTNNSQVVGIESFNCSNCWVLGVRSIDSARAHVQLQYSPRNTVRDSYFFLTQNHSTSSYGFEAYSASDALVENNIVQAVASPLMFNGVCSGCVIGYNFSVNNYYTNSIGYNQNAQGDHTVVDMALVEGNYGNVMNADVIHGTHNLLTYFRNRYTGPSPACYASGSTYATSTYEPCNNNLSPIVLYAFSRFFNIVGNVLGTTGVNDSYINTGTDVLDFGSGNSCCGVTVPTDPNVQTTVMLWGNCDDVNGFGNCRFVPSEVPSDLSGSQAPFANPVPSSHNLPASFYHVTAPSFWPTNKPWPPVGPDVTGGNVSGVGGHVYTIPAQDCYTNMGGLSNGTGPVLTFNASSCYGQQTASPPAPPTSLRAVVQ